MNESKSTPNQLNYYLTKDKSLITKLGEKINGSK